VETEDFTVEKGEDQQSDYSWIPPGKSEAHLHYRFCKTCGVRTYAEGNGGKFYAVAIAMLDGIEQDTDQLAKSLKYNDGRHDDLKHEPADTRLLWSRGRLCKRERSSMSNNTSRALQSAAHLERRAARMLGRPEFKIVVKNIGAGPLVGGNGSLLPVGVPAEYTLPRTPRDTKRDSLLITYERLADYVMQGLWRKLSSAHGGCNNLPIRDRG
jgi:hypothetical protein